MLRSSPQQQQQQLQKRSSAGGGLGTAGGCESARVRECGCANGCGGGCLPAGAGGGGPLLGVFLHHAQVGVQAAVQWAVHMGQYMQKHRSEAAGRLFCCGRSWQRQPKPGRYNPAATAQQGLHLYGCACTAGPPDAHCRVKGDLEGGTLVLRADHGLELLGVHHTLHFGEQGGGGGDGLLRGLALQAGRQAGMGAEGGEAQRAGRGPRAGRTKGAGTRGQGAPRGLC